MEAFTLPYFLLSSVLLVSIVYSTDIYVIQTGGKSLASELPHYDETCTGECYASNLVCTDGICKCAHGYFPVLKNCARCPTLGQICKGCCADGLVCEKTLCQYPKDDPLTFAVSQIALGLALIFGISALATLIWKICFPSYRRGHRPRGSANSGNSLNSIQRLVNERMRNRPPSYAEAVDSTENTVSSAPAVSVRNSVHIHVEAPPAYSLTCSDGTTVITSSAMPELKVEDGSNGNIDNHETTVHI